MTSPAVDLDGADIHLWIPGRPQLVNAERSAHWRAHRATTAETRLVGAQLAWQAGRRTVWPDPAVVVSWPEYKRRPWPDVGNWMPTLKAVIDGLVDAGVWPDDTADHIAALVFTTPRKGPADGLRIVISSDQQQTEGA